MPFNIASDDTEIQGVLLGNVGVFPDERGSFSEVFRSSWFPRCNYPGETQLNLSRTVKGALRGLHFHRTQHDWWIPLQGEFQAALADLRRSSPTFGRTMVFRMSGEDTRCVLIPPGVAHGFLALGSAALLYAVDRYYDGSDEQGVAWDDGKLAIPWLKTEPILSERDRINPSLEELERQGLLPD